MAYAFDSAWNAVSLSGLNGTVLPSGSVTVAGTPLAPSGPELTAPTAASTSERCAAGTCAGAALNAARADWSDGEAATLAAISLAALLNATAPMIAGPRVRPKSRNMLVAPLSMPALSVGSTDTATTVMEVTASLKPLPTMSNGAATAAMLRFVAGIAASHRSPIAMAPMPTASVQPGL